MGNENIKIGYHDLSLSMDVQEARISEVFQELARRTAYEFIVPEELLEHQVTLKCSGVDLSDGVRRIIKNAGVGNYALIYSFPEAHAGVEPLCQVKVVLLDSASSGKETQYSGSKDHWRVSEVGPELERKLASFSAEMIPVAKNVSVFPKQHISASMLQQVSPKGAETASTEVPTSVPIAPENEGFPVYRKLELNQEPTKLQPPNHSSQ
jgi:hypothetical protein